MTGRNRLLPRPSNRFPALALALVLCAAVASVQPPSAVVLASAAEATVSPSPTPLPFSWTLPIEVDAPSVFVVDLARGKRLYEKNTLEPVSLPVANRVMTALIALEEYAPDTKVTISKVAADADSGLLGLKRGEKVDLEYLLLGLLLQDSAAAGIAIAEQVSGEESEFVRKMNVKASNLQMTGTTFVNATGVDAEGQRSTVEDAVLLLRTALTQDTFKRIFQLRDSLYFLPDSTTHHFRSRLDSAWSFLESMTGGIRSDSASGASTAVTARSRGFSILVVKSGSSADKVVTDLTRIVDGVYGHYESVTLASAGQVFPQRESVQGVEFPIVYGANVTYVRPIGAEYLQQLRYESLGRTGLPLRRSQSVGKAVFEMVDGTSIRVDMFPENDVYNPKSELDAIRALIDANPDLASLIALLAGLLVLLLLGSAAERLVRRLRLRRQRERLIAGRIRRP